MFTYIVCNFSEHILIPLTTLVSSFDCFVIIVYFVDKMSFSILSFISEKQTSGIKVRFEYSMNAENSLRLMLHESKTHFSAVFQMYQCWHYKRRGNDSSVLLSNRLHKLNDALNPDDSFSS